MKPSRKKLFERPWDFFAYDEIGLGKGGVFAQLLFTLPRGQDHFGGTPPAGTGPGATNPGVTNTPSPQEDEKKKDDGHSMAEAGTVQSGGLGSGGGVSVGLGKGCGSIVGAGISNGPVSLDFFLAPLVFLIALLAFRKKIL